MRVSQRSDYALRALVLLAMQPEGTYVAAGDLADRLMLPRRFVEQQITALARAGIVVCRRGAGGGCALTGPAEGFTVHDVVSALEGVVIDVPRQQDSAVADVWRRLAVSADDYLASVTIADLAEGQRGIDARSAPVYHI